MYNKNDYEEYQLFLNKVKMHLETMSKEKKDEWIISQAKLIRENCYQDFIDSLLGNKKIQYMPEISKIEDFCKKVRCGEIYLEYETHYLEFDASGRYYGDWDIQYNDPLNAMTFLQGVFKGCHDLILLEEYKSAVDILNEICQLEFEIMDSPESEDCYQEDSGFTIVDAYENNLLYIDRNEVAIDWLYSFYVTNKNLECTKLASELIELMKSPILEKTVPSDVFRNREAEGLFLIMLQLLEDEIRRNKEKIASSKEWSYEGHVLKKLVEQENRIVDDLRKLLVEKESDKGQNIRKSVLESSWKQIHELIKSLSYERYIDDQLEIDEIWKICAAIVKYMKDNVEPWELRKIVLNDIIENEYYDYYGCSDPMENLLDVLCCEEDEYIEMAEIMEQFGKGEKATAIYLKFGYDQRYIECLQKRLAKNSNTYLALIDYYDSHDKYDKALEIAWLALEKCKDDLTDIFVFLIKNAYKNGDEVSANKL